MANTTLSPRRRRRSARPSFRPDPKVLRPLFYKTELGLAFERLAARMGLEHPGAPLKVTATWEGSR